jgi:NAD+ synthase
MVEYNPNYKNLTAGAIKFIQDFFNENGSKDTPAVIGISGGKDSTIVAKLLTEALGKERVIGVLIPNGVQHDFDVSQKVIEYLGIKSYTINIRDIIEKIKSSIQSQTDLEITNQAKINLPPRIRMAILYYINACTGGFVANTSNLSEDWVGYATLWGDSVGDF